MMKAMGSCSRSWIAEAAIENCLANLRHSICSKPRLASSGNGHPTEIAGRHTSKVPFPDLPFGCDRGTVWRETAASAEDLQVPQEREEFSDCSSHCRVFLRNLWSLRCHGRVAASLLLD